MPVLSAAADRVGTVVDDLDRNAPGEVDSAPVDEVAPAYAGLWVASRRLALAGSALGSTLARRLPGDVFEGAGFVLNRRFGKTRKAWDNAALLSRLETEIVRRALYDADGTRREDDQPFDVAVRTFRLVAEVCQLGGSQLRSTVLRKWGISVDNYAEEIAGTVSLEVIVP